MTLQVYTLALGNFRDDTSGNNYAANTPVYILNSGGTLADIFRDQAGAQPIAQDGLNNISDAYGEFTFYVNSGQYISRVAGRDRLINVVGSDYFDSRVDDAVEQITQQTLASRGFRVVGTFAGGFTYELFNDVGIDSDGNSWIYVGAGAPNKVVAAGTVPSVGGGYEQVTFNAAENVYMSNGLSVENQVAQSVQDIELLQDAQGSGGIVHASAYGVTANSSDDQSAKMELALATGKRVDITGLGLVKIGSEIACPSGVRLISFDDISGISGYDGLGCRVTGGDITLENVGVFNYYDGTDLNKTNIATAFCRVSAGSSLGKVLLSSVRADNNRSIVIAGKETDDFNPDVTISTELLKVVGCDIRNTAMPVNWRGLCGRDVCVGNEYKNIIGAGRVVAAHKVYLDGLSSDSGFYEQCKNHLFAHNKVETVVNRTTTGSSSSGNNYECHAVMVSGSVAHIHDNTIRDCTGNRFDTEGIYIKCKDFNIHDNTLIDSGASEGAICMKGVTSDVGVKSGPIGDNGRCVNNIIQYTRNSYANGGVTVDLSGRLLGIYMGVPSRVEICDNEVTGANLADIIIDGYPDSKNDSVSVCDNKSYDFAGQVSIIWNGAFSNPKSNRNIVINPVIPATVGQFAHTSFISVLGRGIKNKNVEVKGNSLQCDISDGRANGKIVSMLQVDLENYDFDGLNTGSNTFDVLIGNANPNVRVYYVKSQTTAVVGFINDLVSTADIVNPNIKVSQWFWGTDRVKSYDISCYVSSTVINELFIIAQFPTITGKVLSLEARTDFSFLPGGSEDLGEVGTRWRIGTYYNNAEAATILNQAELYSFRSAAMGEQTLDAVGSFGRVRLTNNTTRAMTARTKIRAVCV